MWNRVSFIEVSQSVQGQSDKHIDFDTPETADIIVLFLVCTSSPLGFN